MRNGRYVLDQSLGDQVLGLASIEAENARFMGRVYGWMTAGLCLTGAVAWNVAGNPQLPRFQVMGVGASSAYSIAGIIVFSGLAYDTQTIKAMNAPDNEQPDVTRKTAIFGALRLYLDFINLFLSLLQFTGRKQ